jgi:hypothetical protein
MRITTTILLLLISKLLAAQVSIYQRDEVQKNNAYEVFVRTHGGEWQDVPVYSCDVDMHRRSTAAFAEFDMGGTVEIRIRLLLPETITADSLPTMIRPQSRGIHFEQKDKQTVQFTLERPEYLSIEFGGDRHHNLHLFANPMLTEKHRVQNRVA